MEWVYVPTSDEPTVYEADALSAEEPPGNAPLDIFSSSLPVEPVENEEEPEYYGDEDIIEERMPPAKAFEIFAARMFPLRQPADFSDSIYVDTNKVPLAKGRKRPMKQRLPAAESRSQKLTRLRAEVDALAADCKGEQQRDDQLLTDLAALRAGLNEIEQNLNSELRPNRSVRIVRRSELAEENEDRDERKNSWMTVEMVSPNVSVLQSLEKRVTAMEHALGVARLDEQSEVVPLAPLLEDVRTRLDLMCDETLPGRLKKDAEDIARILQSQLQDQKGADMVRMASLLEKTEKWEAVAESLPTVVQRLRCLKRVQDEAAHFMEGLSVLGKQLDALQQRSDTNSLLVESVQRKLEKNVESVQSNIEVLQSRVCAMGEQQEQSS